MQANIHQRWQGDVHFKAFLATQYNAADTQWGGEQSEMKPPLSSPIHFLFRPIKLVGSSLKLLNKPVPDSLILFC